MNIRDIYPEHSLEPEQEQWLCAYRGYLRQGNESGAAHEKACILTGVNRDVLSGWLLGSEYCESDFECFMFDVWVKYHKPE